MQDVLLKTEEYLVDLLQWPLWAIRLNGALIVLVFAVWILQQVVATSKSESAESSKVVASWAFRRFQLQYLSVYLITMLADWLQGTHMYTLYQVHCATFSHLCL